MITFWYHIFVTLMKFCFSDLVYNVVNMVAFYICKQ